MFQGETNAAGGFWDSADEYYGKFVQLNQAWQEDFPAAQARYLFQIRPGAFFAGGTLFHGLQVAEAQRRVAETLPGWQIMSATGMNHDGTHYHYANGYERAGNDLYRLIARDLYGAPAAENMHPPTVDSLYFSSCDSTEITLRLRHANDTYAWTTGWETDFLLEGDPDQKVIAGAIDDATVVLQLSARPGPAFTGLSYTSHPGGPEAPVKNANGIGMLMFYNLPVAACTPLMAAHEHSPLQTAALYPNPATDLLFVRTSSLPDPAACSVAVTDLLGRQVLKPRPATGDLTRIDLRGLPPGLYAVTVWEKGKSVWTGRFLLRD
jgi:hypothetical protein